ncbi:MAG TPA: hypothetical protein VFL14_08700 [Xanthomonadales bacterium]|nr:hypothetical protein [Xanthomonadales bacterium]
MRPKLRAHLRLFALPLLACTAHVHAADALPPSYATDYRAFSFTQPAGDGFWSRGDVSNRSMIARFDATGRVVRAFPYSFGSAPTPTGDGGLFLASSCSAERLDAQGSRLWRSTPFSDFQFSCEPAAIDAAGNSWVYGECTYTPGCFGVSPSIVRLDTRGIARASAPINLNWQSGSSGPLVGARVGTGAWFATGNGVSRIGPDANVVGGWPSSGPVTGLAVDENDRAWGFAPRAAEGTTAARLDYGLIGHDGRVVRSASSASVDRPYVVDTAADATGAVALVGDVTITVGDFGQPVFTYAALRLHRFDAQGAQAWTRDFVPNPGCYPCSVTLAPGGDAVVVVGQQGTPTQPVSRLLRYAPDGTQRSQVDANGTLSKPQAMADGSVMALLFSQTTTGGQFVRYSPQGQLLPTFALADATDGQPSLLASRFERNGIATTLSVDDVEPRQILAGYAADGTLAWRRETPERIVSNIASYWRARMAGNGRRTCWSAFQRLVDNGHRGAVVVECMDATTGAVRFRSTVTETALLDDTKLVVTNDDAVLLGWLGTGSRAQLTEVSPEGTVGATREYAGYSYTLAFNARGDALLGDLTRRNLVLVARDGTQRWTNVTGVNGFSTGHSLADDGTVAYVAVTQPDFTQQRRRLVLVAPDGIVQWRSEEDAFGTDATTAFVAGDPVLAELPRFDSIVERRVTRFSATTGGVRWTWRGPEGFSDEALLVVDAASQSVAIATASSERIRVTSLDAALGTPRSERIEGCANANCAVANAAYDERGGVRFAETGEFEYERPGGPRWRLRSLAAPSDAPRVDQDGLAGAWYPEYAGGQGLFLEWLPAPRVAFGTWFTYTAFGGNTPADLRWYSLQGQLPDDPTRATLGIFANSGGNFAAPPVTTATPVGTALLSLESCGRATLAYQFTAGELAGTSGQYSLARLTQPRGCVDRAGTATPPAPASGGFDAALSGAWFTPATSGQGFDVSVEPGSTLFAAWYTFDPAGSADDAARQHWFTLQGGLAGASGGRVTVPIYATIGGAFDRTATRNTFRVGEATIAFTACNRATLDYRFDANEIAGAYGGRTGSLALERLGGCAN